MVKNIVDLRLRLEGSEESKDLLVATNMETEDLIEEAERVMSEVEQDAYEDNEMVYFHEHAEVLEERLDMEILNPDKVEAICPNLETEERGGSE